MAAGVRVEISRKGIRELLRSPQVAADLTSRGHRVAAATRAGAPRGTPEEPNYREEIQVRSDRTRTRARTRVYAGVPYALKVESKYRVLGRALDAARG